MVLGFMLTISYKSVLLAMLMNSYYENTIDSVDDMLASDRTFMVSEDSIFPTLLASDPRMKVKELAESVIFYKHGTGYENDLKRIAEG